MGFKENGVKEQWRKEKLVTINQNIEGKKLELLFKHMKNSLNQQKY